MQKVVKIRFIITAIRPLTLPVLVFVCVLDVSEFSSAAVQHNFLLFLNFYTNRRRNLLKTTFLSFFHQGRCSILSGDISGYCRLPTEPTASPKMFPPSTQSCNKRCDKANGFIGKNPHNHSKLDPEGQKKFYHPLDTVYLE